MRRNVMSSILAFGLIISLAGCGNGSQSASNSPNDYASHDVSENTQTEAPENGSESNQAVSADGAPTVYMTEDISPEGLMTAYEALGVTIDAENVAVKLSTGETGSNYLEPALIQDLVQTLNGTIVECNTAYGGDRSNTAMHKQLAEDHGYTAIADVDIMDEEGSMSIPIEGGKQLSENLV